MAKNNPNLPQIPPSDPALTRGRAGVQPPPLDMDQENSPNTEEHSQTRDNAVATGRTTDSVVPASNVASTQANMLARNDARIVASIRASMPESDDFIERAREISQSLAGVPVAVYDPDRPTQALNTRVPEWLDKLLDDLAHEYGIPKQKLIISLLTAMLPPERVRAQRDKQIRDRM